MWEGMFSLRVLAKNIPNIAHLHLSTSRLLRNASAGSSDVLSHNLEPFLSLVLVLHIAETCPSSLRHHLCALDL